MAEHVAEYAELGPDDRIAGLKAMARDQETQLMQQLALARMNDAIARGHSLREARAQATAAAAQARTRAEAIRLALDALRDELDQLTALKAGATPPPGEPDTPPADA